MNSQPKKTAVIIGAGPAGLTAAYELLAHTDIYPIVLEADTQYVGGISRTILYKGNRIDIGGHRFFSKSDTVMNWWLQLMPLEAHSAEKLSYQGKTTEFSAKGTADPETTDNVFLVRSRSSRIYHDGKFFAYPITLSFDTLRNLGFLKVIKIGFTYTFRKFFPRRPETTLEDFFINRFGDELFFTFFKSYTEKVWGATCKEISAEWGAQRIKGLSVSSVLVNAILKPFRRTSLDQKNTETSLIEWFLYPKFGPGQVWEVVTKDIEEKGGELHRGERAVKIDREEGKVTRVHTKTSDGTEHTYDADYVFSTMPISELGAALDLQQPVRHISDDLPYRDFMTAGLLLRRTDSIISTVNDNWIYIHDDGVDVGRIQIFNNWSPYLVKDPENTVWVGLEYFCNEGDRLWTTPDPEFIKKAAHELEMLGLAKEEDLLDGVVIRQPKAYTAYTGSYEHFDEVRTELDAIPNLFPIGRNGMHRYNNQDHSMLVAMAAVENIRTGRMNKSNLWEVNAEKEYHEEK